MQGCAFVVFARAPVAGQVKTRLFRADQEAAQAALGRTLSAQDAALLHAAFVEDTLEKGARCGFASRWLYMADASEHATLLRLAATYGYACRVQQGRDLGARMAAAFDERLTSAGHLAEPQAAPGVILVGTDSPTLPMAYLQEAASALTAGCDLVLGPASDGGYYLSGLRRPLPCLFPVDMPWGTAEVLPQTLRRLRLLAAEGVQSHLLPFFYDCDTPADLRLLREHLALSMAAPPAAHAGGSSRVDGSATQEVLRQLGLWDPGEQPVREKAGG